MSRLKAVWNFLSGNPEQFSMENRTYHAASIISICVLFGFLIVNFFLGLWQVLALSAVMFVLQTMFFSLSRFKNLFKTSVVCSASLSYLALSFNYYLNSGINGPTLFIFFFTFNVLVIITPRTQHYIWIIAHTIVVFALLLLEYWYPGTFKNMYPNTLWRILDIFFTYIITLFFLYYVSVYLRNYYKYEKKLAKTRLKELEEQIETIKMQDYDIQNKNNALMKIAFIQSHELRGPVSSILGLMHLIKEADYKHNEEYLQLMEKAVKELDERIHLIIEQTEEFKK